MGSNPPSRIGGNEEMNERDKEMEKMALEAIAHLRKSYDKAIQPYIKILMDIKSRNIEPIIISKEVWEAIK